MPLIVERRNEPRFPFSVIARVQYGNGSFDLKTINVSVSGVLLESSDKFWSLKIGDPVIVTFPPILQFPKITFNARISHVQVIEAGEPENNKKLNFGLEIIKIDEEEENKWNNFIEIVRLENQKHC